MRSRLSVVIILVSIALLIFCIVEGIKIGNIEILSISQLIEKDNSLDSKIEDATMVTAQDYPESVKMLEETYEKFKIQKQKFEELSTVTNENNGEIYETKQYDIGYLWRVLGLYAKQEKFEGDTGVSLALDVKKSNVGRSTYNLNFTVSGTYTRISQFITDIENDSDLYFRIYNFKMNGKETQNEEGETISITEATFTVKNINIDPSTIS